MLDKIRYITNIVIIALMFVAVAIKSNNSILGVSVDTILNPKATEEVTPVETVGKDGERVINSTGLAQDVIGFAGRTPVELYIKDNIIEKVIFLENAETPEFFDQVIDSKLSDEWVGMSVSKAATTPIDAVAGATYSSKAIIENVQRAAQFVTNAQPHNKNIITEIGLKGVAGVLVLLFGVIVTFIKVRSRALRVIQLSLNVVILGFWCGSFLSLASLTSWITNGVNLSLSFVAISMLIITIVMPLFGKKGSYCHNHCPMGAAQELMWLIPAGKLKIGQKTTKILNNIRYYIFVLLIFMMWLGVGMELINYEVFSAFIIQSASPVVLVMAGIFIVLSIFTPRPYCRFICPTGAVITTSQNISAI